LRVSGFTAFFDANVLYPAELRNLLMHLALTGIFRAAWSKDVHEEWIGSLLKNRPDLTRSQLERTRTLMDEATIDSVITGYEHLISTLTLPDKDDRHVLAAAIQGKARVIVTLNLKDFPDEALHRYGIRAQHPDDFILDLIEFSPGKVAEAVENHRTSLKNPVKTVDQYLSALEAQGLRHSVAAMRRFIS